MGSTIVIPLSKQIDDELVKLLQKKENGTAIIIENNENRLLAFSSIGITMGSEKVAFGGSQESIDHIKGNKGEGWHIVISLNEDQAIVESHKTSLAIIFVGTFFTLLTAMAAWLLGKWIASPIVKLATTAKTLGEGYLDTRADVRSNN
ncbi:MAG: hypothetical protein KZQ67_14510 [gamma proteobacterium symbiont of Bathyaustriella thionipta]|nr:hypothetical protein [gamma proteobacterium symbiont of Bathyaustriella thionipta]